MATRTKYILLFALYLLTSAYAFYVGIYETAYSAGAGIVLTIQVLGIIAFVIVLLVSKFNWKYSLYMAAGLVVLLQGLAIVLHRVNEYRPTYTILVPEAYAGPVYLFVTPDERRDVLVDANGIGYIGSQGKVVWEVEHGDEDISVVLHNGGYNEISIRNSTNSKLTAYDVSCFEVNAQGQYPEVPERQLRRTCLEPDAFQELIDRGLVDERALRKRVWRGSGNEEDWTLDQEESRL